MFMDEDLVMISALQHYSYCPRQCALIHMEQAFEENVHTLRGQAVHEQVDEPLSIESADARVEYALSLCSIRLGLVGKADVVEVSLDGTPHPVEYKYGRKRKKEHDDIQLAAQAICLEESIGKPVHYGAIYHHSSRRRRVVEITQELRNKVEQLTKDVKTMLKSNRLPPPVEDNRLCRECSMREICKRELADANHKLISLRKGLFEPEEIL